MKHGILCHLEKTYTKKTQKKTGVNDGILLSVAAATIHHRKPLRHAAATAATA
jgi:hypothetical protein